jgi:cytochrome c oxidase assembly protein subunit 11
MLAVLGVLAMTGLAFASVPLYRLFCQVTGFGGTTMRDPVEAARRGRWQDHRRFDANVSPALPGSSSPKHRDPTKSASARATWRFYTATNTGTVPVGTATYNVTPDAAGKYFTKIQCFCFTEQTLKAGETGAHAGAVSSSIRRSRTTPTRATSKKSRSATPSTL